MIILKAFGVFMDRLIRSKAKIQIDQHPAFFAAMKSESAAKVIEKLSRDAQPSSFFESSVKYAMDSIQSGFSLPDSQIFKIFTPKELYRLLMYGLHKKS